MLHNCFFHVSSVQDRGIGYVIPSLMFYLGCGCVLFIVFIQRFFFLQMYVMPACIILRGGLLCFWGFSWLYCFFMFCCVLTMCVEMGTFLSVRGDACKHWVERSCVVSMRSLSWSGRGECGVTRR